MPSIYKNIIVAIDFSEQSLKSYARAVDFAIQYEAKLHLISVVNTHSNAAVEAFDQKYAEQLYKDYEQKLAKLKEEALAKGVGEVVISVQYGSPKKVLIDYKEADLIVMGASGLNAMERFVLGSVSSNVLRYATCDVFIVR